ncbi:MAG: tripartite tricarboxylate transporter substrate binding protein [Rhizobiales bacterium]|nr:tripartite tricarboxylate transporter substrate binding protein [Hyphomicrobiales bacterium]
MKRSINWVLAVLACAIGMTAAAQAQQYPNRPVRIIVGFAAGSGPDIVARAVGAQLGTDLGQNFFVENRLGANATIAAKAVADASPDGYTLLYTSSGFATTPYIYKKAAFDVLRDFAPIATAGILDGYVLVINPALPIKSVDDLIAYAKANRTLYGSPGVGNLLHIVTELFNLKAGIKLEHVPYRGASDVINALLQGSIQVAFLSPATTVALIEEGKLRAIGFNGRKPFPELPNVPLVTASVPSNPPSSTWGIFFAPAKTPATIVDKLNGAIRHALAVPAVANVVQKAGYIPDGRTAAQTAEFFRQQVQAAGEAVKAAGIQPN